MRRSTVGKLILLCILSMVLITNMMGCSKASPGGAMETVKESEQNQEPVILRLAGGDYGYPSPYLHYSRGPGSYKMRLIFDSLLERGEKGYIPWLAKNWETVESGKAYIFTLQEGVQWQDGEAMTPEDVKFSFEYFEKHPPVNNSLFIDGKSFIEKIEILEGNKLKISVKEPKVVLLEKIGDVRIIPKHIWEKVEDPNKFDGPEAVIGCGPYILEEYNKEQGSYRFKAFENYWGPKQRASAIEFVPVSDAVLAFEQGEIDMITASPDILGRYQQDSAYRVLKSPGFWGYNMYFNMNKVPQLKEKGIRQAIAYAIDREELVEKVARGAGISASAGYLPKDHIWYNPKVKTYTHDIEKAKALLAGKTVKFQLLVQNTPQEVRIGELIKLKLEEAGIQVDVKSVDMKTRDHAIKTGDYEVAVSGYGGWGGDADLIRERYATTIVKDGSASSAVIPGYKNEAIEELARAQLNEFDPEKRKKIIYQLQELIAEEVPQLPLYNTTDSSVFRPDKYDGWMYMFDHHSLEHSKLSYLERD
ncbi:MAG: ABC transporter substrate-binding protein [Thermotaleaceae bacterium]